MIDESDAYMPARTLQQSSTRSRCSPIRRIGRICSSATPTSSRRCRREVATRPFDKSHQVPQCESDAYVWAMKRPDGTLKLHFAVENPSGISAKALAAILEKTLSGLTPAEIATVSPEIVEQIFRQNISMGKGHGPDVDGQRRARARGARTVVPGRHPRSGRAGRRGRAPRHGVSPPC